MVCPDLHLLAHQATACSHCCASVAQHHSESTRDFCTLHATKQSRLPVYIGFKAMLQVAIFTDVPSSSSQTPLWDPERWLEASQSGPL